MAMIRKIINSSLAPKPIGPYNHAVQVGQTIYLSGQIGLVPSTMKMIEGGVEAETRQALKNMENVLKSANSSLDNVVKTTVLLKDIKDSAVVNRIYAEFFVKNFPARAAFQVAELPANSNVEIEGVAIAGDLKDE